ncbi:hypothetical protein [Streptomyces sp. MA5143a]|uniref:hypothetical protein n=1 Tax=Streptomyces sp. MA5143a TaxID=2083010 RepID=UPI00215945D4|nr:hypothetical protein [Streptomyces sp. MA5143a]
MPARPTAPPRPSSAPFTTQGAPGDDRRRDPADGQRPPRGSDAARTTREHRGSGEPAGSTPAHTQGSGPVPGRRPSPGTGLFPGGEPWQGSETDGGPAARNRAEHPRFSDFRRTAAASGATPPPPAASARFPDTPPTSTPRPTRLTTPTPRHVARAATSEPGTPEARSDRDGGAEAGRRLRPGDPGHPGAWQPPSGASRRSADAIDDALGGSPGRPYVTFAEPDTSPWTSAESDGDVRRRPRPTGARAAAMAACVVLGVGLIGGAAAGSWLTGDPGPDGTRVGFAAAGALWHGVPVDELFPPTVQGEGAGPGGTDRTWTRVAVAPDSGCADAFDPLLRQALAPVGCLRLLRATYTDATRSNVTTVGLMFTKADATGMATLKTHFARDGLDRRTDLMPRPYAAKGTVAAGFGDGQRASWTISVLTDVPVVVYAVSGFADGRTITEPQPADDAMRSDATTAPAQAGLGHEAQGLADRVERGLRKTAASASEQPS